MRFERISRGAVCALLLAAVASVGSAPPASAQGLCGNLWYQRNAIYARKGYCFQTARARAVFGPGCFPPYGVLTPYEQQQVAAIQGQERYNGCPP